MDCNDLHVPQRLTELCAPGRTPAEMNSLFKCFYQQFFIRFEQYARKYYFIADEQHIHDAFTDGVMGFYLRVQDQGFAVQGASVETVLIEYCRRTLLGLFTERTRHGRRNVYKDPGELSEQDGWEMSLQGEDSKWLQREDCLQRAWQQLGDRCSKLLRWRKIEKVKKEVVAARMKIDAGSVNSEVYKCVGRLTKIIQADTQYKSFINGH